MSRAVSVAFAFFMAFVATMTSAAERRHGVRPRLPYAPPCSEVVGTTAVAFSSDEGEVLTMPRVAPSGVAYTFGLETVSDGELVAIQDETVLRSSDRGCSWSVQGQLSQGIFPPRLTGVVGGVTYAWSDNRSDLYRIEPNAIVKLTSRVESIVGAGIDRRNSSRLRLASSDGSFMTSTDAGETWEWSGSLPPYSRYYRIAIDPADLDHAVGGSTQYGAFVTFDGGKNWTASTGLSAVGGRVNVFNTAISPVAPSVVWLMALDLDDPSETHHGRHIYRSTDGGLSFTPVIDASDSVHLINGPLMVPHPVDPNVLFFVFAIAYNEYGTDLYRYDAATAELVMRHHPVDGIDSIVFSPDGRIMYAGLESLKGILKTAPASPSARERH